MGKLEGKVAIVTGASRGIGKGTPGFTVPRQIETMGGHRPSELLFENCEVPKENVLGEVGMGFAFAQKWIVNGRLLNHPPASIGAAEIHANKLMMLHACYKADQGKDVRHEAATCKVYASEMGCRVVDKVIRCMRGMGERYYRDLRRSRITEGASEVQRFIMARSLLKGYSPLDLMAE